MIRSTPYEGLADPNTDLEDSSYQTGYWSCAGKKIASALSGRYCGSIESTPSVGYIECGESSLADFEILINVGEHLVCSFDSHRMMASLAMVSTSTKLASPDSPILDLTAGGDSRLAASWTFAAVSSSPSSLRIKVLLEDAWLTDRPVLAALHVPSASSA